MSLDALLHRRPPTWWELFLQAPCKTLALKIYDWHQLHRPNLVTEHQAPLSIVCISDTHNGQLELPAGDLLIHAGDLTQKGTTEELQAQLDWINGQTHQHKVVIAGNHDMILDPVRLPGPDNDSRRKQLRWGDIHYLQDASVVLRFKGGRALALYGSPWTRKHGNWAFQYVRSDEFWADKIPDDTDILITHMPLQCHLDLEGQGDGALLQRVRQVRPRLHVFGHFHASAGTDIMAHDNCEDTYEAIIQMGGGIMRLFRFIWSVWIETKTMQPVDRTVLVNASYVGGYLDERRREPVVVRI
ncbi:putative calcineurin-like phosphoesterase 1 [Elsinoe fawcettii]|nr:putative calcineurin-like phosphoesterase 1 [Elsinoe fawcettii]